MKASQRPVVQNLAGMVYCQSSQLEFNCCQAFKLSKQRWPILTTEQQAMAMLGAQYGPGGYQVTDVPTSSCEGRVALLT